MSDTAAFDDVRELYSAAIRQHARDPAHQSKPAGFDVSARGDNPMCGDRVSVFVRREGGRVGAAGFEARGCEISIASADLMCDAVAGLALGDVRPLADRVAAMARTGVCEGCGALQPLSAVHAFPSRVKCVTLPWQALLAALDGAKEATSE